MSQRNAITGLIPAASIAAALVAIVVLAGISYGIFGGSGNFRAQTGGGARSLASSAGFCGPVCGDRIIMEPEECDDGARNSDVLPDACRTACVKAHCGDGVTDSGEQCDDGAGNGNAGGGCRTNCTAASGGSSSSTVPGTHMACSNNRCVAAQGAGADECSSDAQCGGNNSSTSNSGNSSNGGNSGNSSSGGGVLQCGNGVYEPALGEMCDDGNTSDGDGCSSLCETEDGWMCFPSP
ncbi:DUF4215 domain-containing protein [Candidatus Peregrinibacteria bacterium]|nr:DUF4215 domain-containing protein [Candidatus Peregrinibacteria bacterium]